MKEKIFDIHITGKKGIKLNDLITVLEVLKLSVNDYYRDNKVANKDLSKNSPTIKKVQEGSILLQLGISVFAGVAANVLSQLITSRFRKKEEKNNNSNTNVSIYNIYFEGDTINIEVDNSGDRK